MRVAVFRGNAVLARLLYCVECVASLGGVGADGCAGACGRRKPKSLTV